MLKKIFKCFSIISVFSLSFFAFNYFAFAEENKITNKLEKEYELEFVQSVPRTYSPQGGNVEFAKEFHETRYNRYGEFGVSNGNFVCKEGQLDSLIDCNDSSLDDTQITGLLGSCSTLAECEAKGYVLGETMFFKEYTGKYDKEYWSANLPKLNVKSKSGLKSFIYSGENRECIENGGCALIEDSIYSEELSNLTSKVGRNLIFINIPYMESNDIQNLKNIVAGRNVCSDENSMWGSVIGNIKPYGVSEYDYCNSSMYAAYTYALNNSTEINGYTYDYIYDSISVLEDIRKQNEEVYPYEKNTYVCIGKLTASNTKENGTDYDYGFQMLSGLGNSKDEALKMCNEYFFTNYANQHNSLGTQTEEMIANPVYTYALYKVKNVNFKSNTLNGNANGVTCTWKQPDRDIDMSFTIGVDYTNSKIKIYHLENIKNFYTATYLNLNDIERIINKDDSILRDMENSIYSKEAPKPSWEVATEVIVWTLDIALSAAAIVSAIPTGGTSLGFLGVATLIKNIAIATGKVIFYRITAELITKAVLPFLAYAGDSMAAYVGQYKGSAWLYYGKNISDDIKPDFSAKINNVKCNFIDTNEKFDIKPNVKVECETIMDGKFGDIIKYIMNILRFVACGILILFSVIDFVKPIISGDAEMLTKSGKTFVKRLIIFVLILFLPAVITLLLELIGQSSCNI